MSIANYQSKEFQFQTGSIRSLLQTRSINSKLVRLEVSEYESFNSKLVRLEVNEKEAFIEEQSAS